MRKRVDSNEEQFKTEYKKELNGSEDNSGNFSGKKANEIMDILLKNYSEKLSEWYIENIDRLIEDVIEVFKREITEMNMSRGWWQFWR